jgi:hypothetical protein
MSNDIRLTRLKLEAIEIDSRFDDETRKIFSEFKLNESQLNEGLLDTIKEKIKQMFGVAQKNPEALKAKVDNMEQQFRAQGKDAELEKINSFVERFKRNFFAIDDGSVGTLVAALSLKATMLSVILPIFSQGVEPSTVLQAMAWLNAPMAINAIVALFRTLMGKGQVEPKQATV